jgi:DNA-binding HxlR family transcriptional regulator
MTGELRSNCPIAATLDLIGDRWTLVILRDLLLGGGRRFSELAVTEGIATNVLSERLERLTLAGLITVSRDPNDGRRKLYAPTEAAIALIPVLMELAAWGLTFTAATHAQEIIASFRRDRDAVINALVARARAITDQV